MTFSEVLINLEKQYGKFDSYSDDYSIGKFYEEESGSVEGVGDFTEVYSLVPTTRDEGSDPVFTVKYFPQHDLYIRIDGYYSSYDGLSFYDGWGNCKEVRPSIQTVTVYE